MQETQERKQKLIEDIQNLLNTHQDVSTTSINPALLEFMDEKSLLDIINLLLDEIEKSNTEVDTVWLEQFKRI